MDNKIKLISRAFKEGGMIPVKNTCQGEDVSPQLAWENLPSDTKTIAIICDDPDAPGGDFVHWVIFNIPGNARTLDEGLPKHKILANGARQGESNAEC
jgi:Raf kinase inhibitor-like YbhB/YbcL family protein